MCKIKVRFNQTPERRGVFDYALSVEVVSASGVSPKIFVYHQSPAGIEGNTFAEFDHVATPVDLQEIPEDAASETVPWYRTDKCTVWLRNTSDIETAKQLFVDDVGSLQKSMERLANGLSLQTDVEFSQEGVHAITPGYEPEDPISERIARLEEEMNNKVSKDALEGVEIATNTPAGVRKAADVAAEALGASIIRTASLLWIASLCFGLGAAEVQKVDFNTLNMDDDPSIVTDVTFDGLVEDADLDPLFGRLDQIESRTNAWNNAASAIPGDYENVSNRAYRAVLYRTDETNAVDIGIRTTDSVVGAYSVVEGHGNAAIGDASHAEGQGTKATNICAHAEGVTTKAFGYASHAEGVGSTASGSRSHAEGWSTFATNYNAHAEGYNTKAYGHSSHAEGFSTTASGDFAHAEGYNTEAYAFCSHAEGANTIATNKFEYAQGRYNLSHYATNTFGNAGNTLSSIGFGTGDNDRRNAMEVMQDGKVFIKGVGGYNGTNPRNATDVAIAIAIANDEAHFAANESQKAQYIAREAEHKADVAAFAATNYTDTVAAAKADLNTYTTAEFTTNDLWLCEWSGEVLPLRSSGSMTIWQKAYNAKPALMYIKNPVAWQLNLTGSSLLTITTTNNTATALDFGDGHTLKRLTGPAHVVYSDELNRAITVKSVKLDGTALTPDANGAVNVPALPLSGGNVTGDIYTSNSIWLANSGLWTGITQTNGDGVLQSVDGAANIGASFADIIKTALGSSPHYAPLASPVFTGTPTAPTPQTNAPSNQVANVSYVNKVADEVSPLVARSFTVPKNGPDGYGGASTIFFYPRYLGMSNGDRMKSFIVRRRISGGSQTAVSVYVELQDSSGVTLATTKTQILPAELGVYVSFEFPESVAISNKDAQYRLVFYNANNTSSPYTANLNFYQYPENNPDCYFGTYSQAFVPELTVQYYAWASDLVPTSRKVNGHALTEDVTLTANDIDYAIPGDSMSVQLALESLETTKLGKTGNQMLDGTLTVNSIDTDRVELYENGDLDAIGLSGAGLLNPNNDNIVISWPALDSSDTLALLSEIYAAVQQIAPDFTDKAYVLNDLCTYNGVVYRCKSAYTATASSPNPNSDTTHWEAKKVSELFLLLSGGEVHDITVHTPGVYHGSIDLYTDGVDGPKIIFRDSGNNDIFVLYDNGIVTHNRTITYPASTGTLALLQDIGIQMYQSGKLYADSDLVIARGALYKCIIVESSSTWVDAEWEKLFDLTPLAPLASPAFTGTPTAPTPTAGDDSTKVATTAFVQTAISGISVTPLAGQTFDFATTQGVMDALKATIEALGGSVTNAPSATISQGE